jgi:hypothetical protein
VDSRPRFYNSLKRRQVNELKNYFKRSSANPTAATDYIELSATVSRAGGKACQAGVTLSQLEGAGAAAGAAALPDFSALPQASMLPRPTATRPTFSTFFAPPPPVPAHAEPAQEEPYYSRVTRIFGLKRPTQLPPPPPPLPMPLKEIKLKPVRQAPLPPTPPPTPPPPPPLPPRNVSTHIYEEPDLGARPKIRQTPET